MTNFAIHCIPRDRREQAPVSNQAVTKCLSPCLCVHSLVLLDGSIIFLGSGKFSVGCGKGATFPFGETICV